MSERKDVATKPSVPSRLVASKSMGTKQRDTSKDRTIIKKQKVPMTDAAQATNNSRLTKIKELQTPNTTKTSSTTTVNKKVRSTDVDAKSTKKDVAVNKIVKVKKEPEHKTTKTTVTKPTKIIAPDTPSNSKVIKTQYFPSKNLYTNALQDVKHTKTKPEVPDKTRPQNKISQELNKTRIGKPGHAKISRTKSKTERPISEAKQIILKDLKAREEPQLKKVEIERPRTATLSKGSIVNSNIVGPDVPKSEPSKLTSASKSTESENGNSEHNSYDDDFDSYESDFEEYSSSESLPPNFSTSEEETSSSEDNKSPINAPSPPKSNTNSAETDDERKLDSGNFDLAESKHIQILSNITESSEHEKTTILEHNRSNLTSLSDEGFEEGKGSSPNGNVQFINFLDAQKKQKRGKNLRKIRKRGEEILGMIRLDSYNFTLLDISPVPYDIFIKSYGKSNRVQVSTQTGDDNNSEETQTDIIASVNKWNQIPVSFSKIDSTISNYLEIYQQEYLGVGDDFADISTSTLKLDSYNHKKLENFLAAAGQVILSLLAESTGNVTQKLEANSANIPFSEGYIKINTCILSVLKENPVSAVNFSFSSPAKLLTVHKAPNRNQSQIDDFPFETLICIWNTLTLLEPEKLLVSYGTLNCCCFLIDINYCVIGGSSDGSINIWNLNEHPTLHIKYIDKDTGKEFILRTATYRTEIGMGHDSNVVAIQPLVDAADSSQMSSENNKNYKICSLDEDGTIIIWNIVVRERSAINISADQGLAHWGQISLVHISKIYLNDFNPDLSNLQCTGMSVNLTDTNHLFISTNHGCVLHCLTSGTKANPRRFTPASVSEVQCLDICPFSPLYFMAGYENGNISLFTRSTEKPLITVSVTNHNAQCQVEILQWSYNKPCILYATDNKNTIHIWDLEISDMFPVYSIPFKEKIVCMKSSPALTNNDALYMLLTTANGSTYLHVLNQEHRRQSSEKYKQDMLKFLNYVNRL